MRIFIPTQKRARWRLGCFLFGHIPVMKMSYDDAGYLELGCERCDQRWAA